METAQFEFEIQNSKHHIEPHSVESILQMNFNN